MSEIRMDVDLEHPAERIWRALTEAKVLSQWLELPGFAPVGEAEVTGVEGQRRLAMLWGNDELSTRLVWELAPTPDGATLTLRQSCVYGEWEDEQREEVRAAYGAVLHERLPAILDWLAFQEVDLNKPAPGTGPAEPITEVIPFVPPRRHRRRIVAVVVVALAFLGIVGAVALSRGGDDEPAAAPQTGAPQPSPSLTAPAGVAQIGPGAVSTSPSASPPTTQTPTRAPTTGGRTEGATAPAALPVLGAAYETTLTRIFGYEGAITVRNTGKGTADQWAVVVTLNRGARVTEVTGAEFSQDDRTVTFTGAPLAPAASVRFEFKVEDASLEKGPTACEVDGRPCS